VLGVNEISAVTSDSCKEKVVDSFPLPVDLIRTIAIFLVILLHASVESYSSLILDSTGYFVYWWSSTIYNSIALPCVPLFVMLTGALLLQPSKINEPIRVFLKKRLGRISLVFAFWSVVFFAWSYFADHTTLSVNSIFQGFMFAGAYYHFWFIFLIIGLYLMTPILRVVVAHAERKILRYLVVLWFVGVSIMPLLELSIGYSLNSSIFLIGGWVGYFVLGAYLTTGRIRVRTWVLYGLLASGFVSTMIGAWVMAFPLHSVGRYFFFFDSLTVNVIVASIALFIILSKYPTNWPGTNHPNIGKVIHAISENTLPIYLFHMIILLSLQRGYFGFKLSLTTLNPFIEIPLSATITLFITLALILLMKKVPVLKKLIG
jgi:surface polysaccharide O-acyltransferase-like enzyme